MSWPSTIDDQVARRDWNWQPEYDLRSMTEVMLREVELRFGRSRIAEVSNRTAALPEKGLEVWSV